MKEKFKGKYRIQSHRLKNWNYASKGVYFITIVTQNHICNLGEIVNENGAIMQLSEFGKIVDVEWKKSFSMRNELLLDTYVIMPNHIHGIVILDNPIGGGGLDDIVETHGRASTESTISPFPKINFIVYCGI